MAQIITLPRSISFTRQFEELPLYSEKAANGDLFYAGLVDGNVEISFDGSGDYWISDINLKVDNGRRVKDGGTTKLVNINGDENPSLFWHILDVFTDKYHEIILEWIYEEMAERGLRIAA